MTKMDLKPEAVAMVNFVKSFGISAGGLTYVSAPITTGREYLRWRCSLNVSGETPAEDLDSQHRAEVVERNIQNACLGVAEVRKKYSGLVVDPTAMADVPGWEQVDYHNFWVELIERYVDRVIFLDGWEFSSGAAMEYEAAQAKKIECLDQRGHEIERPEGVARIGAALSEFHAAGVRAPILVAVRDRLV